MQNFNLLSYVRYFTYRFNLAAISICLVAASFCCNCADVLIYGHRGARGLAPENTLPAFAKAVKQGVDYVDLDIVMTKDNVLVVQHDLTLNPDLTRDNKGKWIKKTNLMIKNMTFKELQSYDVGKIKPGSKYAALFPAQKSVNNTHIPKLQDVIRYVNKKSANRVGFQIEIKTYPTLPAQRVSYKKIAMELDKIIRQEGIIKRTKVQAYDWRVLQELQNIDPKIITSYITDSSQEKIMHNKNQVIYGTSVSGAEFKKYHYSIPAMIKAMGGLSWDAEDVTLTGERISEAHKLGLTVSAWSWPERTGRDVDILLIKKLVCMHVDGIITDRPDIVIKELRDVKKTMAIALKSQIYAQKIRAVTVRERKS